MFCIHVLEGKTPPLTQPYFFGATLIPLRKKDGGIRPIAVGLSLRRLVAKCASLPMIQSVGADLAPQQLGCGIPLGCDAAAHATRCYLHNMPPKHLLLKLDFKNAFNSLRRDKMLEAVKHSAPELFPFIYSAYAKPSHLFCGDQVIQSAEGVQQGDPLGSLLFCMTIQPVVLNFRSEFRVFYLDDGTLGGPVQDVLFDLQQVEAEATTLGLQLNRNKTELICDDGDVCDEVLSAVPGLRVINRGQATLLGSPIGSIDSVDDFIHHKVEKLKLMGERLELLPSQDSLLLLRHSFSIPKILYGLRTAPCFSSGHLHVFDETVRSILSKILNVNLAQESAWMQASLPVRAGGVGVRRAVQLAPSAYLASAAGCSELMREILPSHLQNTTDPSSEAALACWSQGHSKPPPSAPDSFRQKAWDLVQIETTFDSLLESAPNQQARARLLAVSTSESGAWLHALPISALGLRMDDDVIRIAVGLRLGLPLCWPHCCSNCGSAVDNLGTHELSCRFSKGRHSRHAALNDIIKRSLESAKVPCHLEPTGLYRSDGKRPDGASVVPWRGGKVLVWDATCADTLAPSHISLAVRESGAVAADAELRKKQKYLLLDSTHHFVPVAVETLGPIGQEARVFLREVARRITASTQEPLALQYLLQRVAVAVQRGNTASVLGSL